MAIKYEYIKPSAVKKYIRENKKRVSPTFLVAVDRTVGKFLKEAVQVHNGGKKTLDVDIAAFVGMKW